MSAPPSTRLALLAVLALATLPSAARAQAPERGPVVVDLAFGARGLGMGGAFQTDAGDPDAVFVNPALAAQAGGFSLGAQRFDTESTAFSISTARAWYGGGIFGGIRHLDAAGATAPGLHTGGIDPLLAGGGTGASETALTLGYGRELFGLRTGVSTSWLQQRYGASNAATFSFDLGVSTDLGPGTVHLAARNLGSATTWGAREVELPSTVAAGWGAYGRQLGPLDWGGAVTAARRADGEWTYGGGLEFGYWPVRGRTFMARIGAQSVPDTDASPLTFGGSYLGDELVIDYAFQAVDGFDGVHRITLGWR
ncbi:hypothetical protein V3331_16190 [Gaopeijia maritima]|uniref:hypothetical protein n=1 Tax=Gaopeijia maritima TaxID=3119007 RepID=UPI00324A161F